MKFGLTDGHLIYATGEEEEKLHVIDPPGIRIHCHALDLDQGPEQLLAAVDRIGQLIRFGARSEAISRA
ncbi:hypothetical protein OS914_17670 [Arthrobacter sp. H14-L1]|nr:hypothetical protein [Arthrobacter sp. H14-L1]